MNRQLVSSLLIIAIAFAVATVSAQQHRPYNLIMKDVGATLASLKKNLDENSGTAAADDAAKLQALFTETEAFWALLNTKDAVGFAKNARAAAVEVRAAAKGNDIKAAQAKYTDLQKNCGQCHFTHREDTGKGFLIRP